jgi:glycogen debranching enzyme
MITHLGATQVPGGFFTASLRDSLETIASYQSANGQMPNTFYFPDGLNKELHRYSETAGLEHFDGMDTSPADFAGGNGGCTDATSLYTIGRWYHYKVTGDIEFLRRGYPALKRSLTWISYQDQNNCGLIEVQEGSDWADIFPNRYNSLMANVLYYAQLKCMADIARHLGLTDEVAPYEERADQVKKKTNLLLWISHDENVRKEMLKACRIWFKVAREFQKLESLPYYLPYASFHEIGTYMDVFANLLAIIFGVADRQRRELILDHIQRAGINKPFPVRSFDPPIRPVDKDWRPYMSPENAPYEYHNGAVWPFIGGFYIAALVKAGRSEDASRGLHALAEVNKRAGAGEEAWQFKEWFHGMTGEPHGGSWMPWNAGMYLYAYHSVKNRTLPVLGDLFSNVEA